jgi:hypothetical protein
MTEGAAGRCRSAERAKPICRCEARPPDRFLLAEVHDGQITHLTGYATEPEAENALHANAPPHSEQRGEERNGDASADPQHSDGLT